MKIAYIIPSKANAGPVIVVKELVKQMIIHGHYCMVYYFDEINEVDFICETKKISFYDSIDFNKFDIVHSHGLRPDLYVFFHKPFKCKSKAVSTLHNYVLDDFSYQYNKFIAYTIGLLWIKLLCRHNKIVTLSKHAMYYYRKFISKKKLFFAYNTREISDLNEPISIDDKNLIENFRGNSIIIGVNAALTERKGVDQLISALPKLINYKLIIIGEGKSRSNLKDLVNKFNLNDRVLFMGYKNNAYRYLPYYDIYALPSRSEGFVLTLLEAAIYMKKIVCSDIPIFKETLSQEEAVFFKLNDIESLIQSIKTATNIDDLGNKLNNRYKSEYSPECFYKKYIFIYQQ